LPVSAFILTIAGGRGYLTAPSHVDGNVPEYAVVVPQVATLHGGLDRRT